MNAIVDEQPARDARRSGKRKEESDKRLEFERDRDRVFYSSAFRRLSGVSQVSAVNERRLLHNRLTHSLKVGQVARRLAQQLQRGKQVPSSQIDFDVTETAGICHDLGHPPFGHVAEGELNQLCGYACGGFEGNAQSFRIVTKLAVRRAGSSRNGRERGLDLTQASLNAILKYPVLERGAAETAGKPHLSVAAEADDPWTDRRVPTKWGVYPDELPEFEWARSGLSEQGTRRTPEAVIVDWADDVSYALHDIDDYYRAGLLTIAGGTEQADFISYVSAKLGGKNGFDSRKSSKAIGKLFDELPLARRFSGDIDDREAIQAFTSMKLCDLLDCVEWRDQSRSLHIPDDRQYAVSALKELVWFFVIDRPSLAALQEGYRRVVRELYEVLLSWLADPSLQRVPARLRDLYELGEDDEGQAAAARRHVKRIQCTAEERLSDVLKKQEEVDVGHDDHEVREAIENVSKAGRLAITDYHKARAACDFISSLTEIQALDLCRRISGVSELSLFDAWFD